MTRMVDGFQSKWWVKKPGKKVWPPVGLSKLLADLGCTTLSEVTESEEKTQLFLHAMDKLFATETREYWVKKLRELDIICAPINTLLEASKDPMLLLTSILSRLIIPKWER